MSILLNVLFIIGLRLIDVPLGTLRIMLLTRGSRWRSGLVGFLESLTWVTAATLVLREVDDPVRMVAFATGFGLGTILGVSLERWLAPGTAVVQVVSPVASPEVAPELRSQGFGVTVLNGEGRDGDVRISLSVIPRRQLRQVLQTVRSTNPDAFTTIEDVFMPRWPRASAVRK